ncbi:MAG: YdcF family protein [Alphaproteobacteria bacterium]
MGFELSKIGWGLLNPGNLFLLLALAGIACLFTRWRKFGRRLLAYLGGIGLLVAILPAGAWLLAPLERSFPAPSSLPAKIDGIVVLGGAVNLRLSRERGQVVLNQSAERVHAFADLARRYPAAALVYTGGSGDLWDQTTREADLVAPYLAQLGVPPDRVRFERDSRDTSENARFSKRLVEPKPGEVWLLVTSAAHMPRSIGAFRKAGWPVIAYPVDFRTGPPGRTFDLNFDFAGGLYGLTQALREWAGLAAYYLSGRIDSLLPRPT